jgi:hypothetical protein
MTNPNSLRDSADKAYDFWKSAGAWVGAHPKTTIVIVLVVNGLAAWV